MRRSFVLAVVAATGVALAGCGSSTTGERAHAEQGCPPGSAATPGPFVDQVRAEHSPSWRVEYRENQKILRVSGTSLGMGSMGGGSMGGGSSAEQTFVLYRCGTPKPELTGDLAGATPVQVPIRTAAVGEPAIPAAFEVLAPQAVVAHDERSLDTSVARTMPRVTERVRNGQSTPIGHGAQLNIERLIERSPDVLFVAGGDDAKLQQVKDAGIPAVSYSAFTESPLGSAEQVKLLSLFTNQEKQANAYASGTIARYQELSAKARAQPERPTVLVGSNGHGPDFTARQRDYFDAALLRDAGTRSVVDQPGRSMVQVPMEKVVDAGSDADFWFQTNFTKSGQTARQITAQTPPMSQIKALNEGRAYSRSQPKEYSSWGLLHPDLLLADVVSVVHPELVPGHRPQFFSKIPPG